MYNNIIGNKYEQVKDLDIREIAKLIRKDLKQFKDCKLNVSISRYANGQTLWVKLKKCDDPNKLKKEQNYLSICPNFYKQIEDVINQYNFDKSHLQSDYYHVNFSSHITCDL
jgi:hypothetical protein|tara:strand:+ start:268 stop:603 length:336 start_codon:yes stop_codon:yes gene_type:complete